MTLRFNLPRPLLVRVAVANPNPRLPSQGQIALPKGITVIQEDHPHYEALSGHWYLKPFLMPPLAPPAAEDPPADNGEDSGAITDGGTEGGPATETEDTPAVKSARRPRR